MREPVVVAPGATGEYFEWYLMPITCRPDGCNHVERSCSGSSRRFDVRRDSVHACSHINEFVAAELIATSMNRRADERPHDWLSKRADGDIDDAGGETPPACMHDAELTSRSDEDDRRTITDPTAEYRIVDLRDRDVPGGAVEFTRGSDVTDTDPVLLIEHRPGEVDQRPAALVEFRQRDVLEVEVAVEADRTTNLQRIDGADRVT